jgi:hypothetical protein
MSMPYALSEPLVDQATLKRVQGQPQRVEPFTFDELDPTGKIPGFKYCAVQVTRATA